MGDSGNKVLEEGEWSGAAVVRCLHIDVVKRFHFLCPLVGKGAVWSRGCWETYKCPLGSAEDYL